MKKIWIFIAVFFINFMNLSAQEASIEWGDALDKSNAEPIEILGEYGDDLYVLAQKGNKYYYQRFKVYGLSLEVEREIEFPKIKGTKPAFEKLKLVKDQVFVFYSNFQSKSQDLYVGKLDKMGDFKTEEKPLFSIEAKNKNQVTDFKFDVSLDLEYVAASVLSVFPRGKDKKKLLGVKVYNNTLKEVNALELELPVDKRKRKFKIQNLTTDNDGNIHVLYALERTENVFGKGQRQVVDEMVLVSQSRLDKKMHTTPLKLAIPTNVKTGISNSILEVNSKGDVCVFGFYFYTKYVKRGSIGGVYFTKVDGATHSVTTNTYEKFSREHGKQLVGEKLVDKRSYGFATGFTNLQYLYFNKDGGFTVLAEDIMNMDFVSGTDNFYAIRVMDISSEGKIDRIRTINKYQSNLGATIAGAYAQGLTDGGIVLRLGTNHYYSYLHGVKEGKMYFVFNDHPDNVGVNGAEFGTDYKPLQNPPKGIPLMVEIDEEGNVSDRKLVKIGNDGMRFRPAVNYKMENGDVIVFGNVKKIQKLGKIVFK